MNLDENWIKYATWGEAYNWLENLTTKYAGSEMFNCNALKTAQYSTRAQEKKYACRKQDLLSPSSLEKCATKTAKRVIIDIIVNRLCLIGGGRKTPRSDIPQHIRLEEFSYGLALVYFCSQKGENWEEQAKEKILNWENRHIPRLVLVQQDATFPLFDLNRLRDQQNISTPAVATSSAASEDSNSMPPHLDAVNLYNQISSYQPSSSRSMSTSPSEALQALFSAVPLKQSQGQEPASSAGSGTENQLLSLSSLKLDPYQTEHGVVESNEQNLAETSIDCPLSPECTTLAQALSNAGLGSRSRNTSEDLAALFSAVPLKQSQSQEVEARQGSALEPETWLAKHRILKRSAVLLKEEKMPQTPKTGRSLESPCSTGRVFTSPRRTVDNRESGTVHRKPPLSTRASSNTTSSLAANIRAILAEENLAVEASYLKEELPFDDEPIPYKKARRSSASERVLKDFTASENNEPVTHIRTSPETAEENFEKYEETSSVGMNCSFEHLQDLNGTFEVKEEPDVIYLDDDDLDHNPNVNIDKTTEQAPLPVSRFPVVKSDKKDENDEGDVPMEADKEANIEGNMKAKRSFLQSLEAKETNENVHKHQVEQERKALADVTNTRPNGSQRVVGRTVGTGTKPSQAAVQPRSQSVRNAGSSVRYAMAEAGTLSVNVTPLKMTPYMYYEGRALCYRNDWVSLVPSNVVVLHANVFVPGPD